MLYPPYTLIGPWRAEDVCKLGTPQLSGTAQYVKLPLNSPLSLAATQVYLESYSLKEQSRSSEIILQWQQHEETMDKSALGTFILL